MAKRINSQKDLYEKRNTDDVFGRVVIAGLLDALNAELFYSQVWENGREEIIHVPFFYTMAHSGERFIQDNYMFFKDLCKGNLKIDGSFDIIPRGVISLMSSSIEAGSITNRFVLGEYVRPDEDGIPRTYVSYLYSLPTKMSFDCKILVDNNITLFKLQSQINEAFYKNKSFKTTYRGLTIRCRYGIPENQQWQKPVEYKMGVQDSTVMEIGFSIDVETFQPMFDPTTEQLKGNTIKSFGYEVSLDKSKKAQSIGTRDSFNQLYAGASSSDGKGEEKGYIYPRYSYSGNRYAAGRTLSLAWHYDKVYGEMKTISIYYKEEGKEEVHIKTTPNNMVYDWTIPYDFIDEEERRDISLTISSLNEEDIITMPEIEVLPDMDKGLITEESFFVVNQGLLAVLDNTKVVASISYPSKSNPNNLVEHDVTLNIRNGMVDLDRPVILEQNKPLTYRGKRGFKKVDIIIQDTQNKDISCTIEDIIIE